MRQTARTTQLTVRLSLFLAVVWIVFLLIGGAADAEAPPIPTTEHLVESGDTLWAIASLHTGPGEDNRIMVAEIRRASGLETSTIHPGQILQIPQS